MVAYRDLGVLVIKSELNEHLTRVKTALKDLGVGYLELEADALETYLPNVDTRSYLPCKTMDNPDFSQPSGGQIQDAIWIPESGYISDPQLATHNVQVTAEARAANSSLTWRRLKS